MPKRALTNYDLEHYVQILGIPYFRGVFCRDDLPATIRRNETGILNLDTNKGKGSHWVAYYKKGAKASYFDSFGNLRPPKELVSYFQSDSSTKHIWYNHDPHQKFQTVNCGHLCLRFLYNQFN